MLNLYFIKFKSKVKMSYSNYDNDQGLRNSKSRNYGERSNFKGRYSNSRDRGGFRIRLSDNEMKAVKTLQETFELKSTVAVLGFAVRTLSEIIQDEEIRKKISKYIQNNRNSSTNSKSNLVDKDKNPSLDPFARPIKNQQIETEVKENGDEK